MRMSLKIALTVLIGPLAVAFADEPPTPWGKSVDGLACRLIVRENYCLGETITVIVEIKNLSKEKRFILDRFNIMLNRHAKLAGVGPGGKRLRQHRDGQRGYHPRHWKAIAPGEVRRIEFADLADYFGPKGFTKLGKYALTYTHVGKKPPAKIPVRVMEVGGRKVTVFETPDGDRIAKAWVGTIVSNTAACTLIAPTAADLTVHEWGVFTVYPNAEYANAGRRAEWATMPEFFYRQFPHVRLRWVPAAWDKPIVYFHSKRACLKVEVEVAFTKGAPVLWWPACSKPLDMNVGGINVEKIPRAWKQGTLFRKLTWSAVLGRRIPQLFGSMSSPPEHRGWREVSEFPLPKECWLTDARRVKAAMPVTVTGSKMVRGRPWSTDRIETERFIYYDGLVPAPDFLRCVESSDDSVTLKNTAGFAISELFIVDRRAAGKSGGGVRFTHVKNPLAGGTQRRIALVEVAPDQWPVSAIKPLRKALLAAGLFADEVDVMLKIWRTGLFDRPGLTAWYILPRAEYDRMLPLKITPTPGAIVRVGLAVHPHLEGTAAIEKQARRLIVQLDAEDFATRETASRALLKLAPASSVLRLLREALKSSASAEVREHCRHLLDVLDVPELLKNAK